MCARLERDQVDIDPWLSTFVIIQQFATGICICSVGIMEKKPPYCGISCCCHVGGAFISGGASLGVQGVQLHPLDFGWALRKSWETLLNFEKKLWCASPLCLRTFNISMYLAKIPPISYLSSPEIAHSAIKRLKKLTYLRVTTGQARLNHLCPVLGKTYLGADHNIWVKTRFRILVKSSIIWANQVWPRAILTPKNDPLLNKRVSKNAI